MGPGTNRRTAPGTEAAGRPATVLFVAYLPSAEGGGQLNLLTLAERLDRSRLQPMIAVPSEGSLAVRARGIGVPVCVAAIRHPLVGAWAGLRLGGSIASIVRLHRLIVREDIRAVVVDGADHVLPAWAAARPAGVPVVWHAQTSFETRHDPGNVRRAAAVVGCTALVTERLARLGAGDRAICIPNAVDTGCFNPEGPAAVVPGAVPGEVGVLYVGAMGAHKGVDDLVEALPALLEHHPSIRLWAAGKKQQADVQRLAGRARQLGVESAIRWLGYRDDMPALLRAAACFAFPSRAEGLSLALLEAMAAGCPVVASDIPGNRVVVDDSTGALVPVGSPGALAEAILELLDNPDVGRSRAAAARARVLERHRIEDFVRSFERVLSELVP